MQLEKSATALPSGREVVQLLSYLSETIYNPPVFSGGSDV